MVIEEAHDGSEFGYGDICDACLEELISEADEEDLDYDSEDEYDDF